jgi:short-subunit dehydrogenase
MSHSAAGRTLREKKTVGKGVSDECDLVVSADERSIEDAAHAFRGAGAAVHPIEADLATLDGVDALYRATAGRPVDALFANAGHGLGRAFLYQDFAEVRVHRGMAEPGSAAKSTRRKP